MDSKQRALKRGAMGAGHIQLETVIYTITWGNVNTRPTSTVSLGTLEVPYYYDSNARCVHSGCGNTMTMYQMFGNESPT